MYNRHSGCIFYVQVDNKPVYEYPHQDDKIFIEGRKNSRYEIYVHNTTSIRKKIVVSVDGLNVMTGTASWERGYVLDPHASITIPGWRIDGDKVAAFQFSTVDGSYNQHNDSGDATNVGVIGVLVSNEKLVHHEFHHDYVSKKPWVSYGAHESYRSLTKGGGEYLGPPVSYNMAATPKGISSQSMNMAATRGIACSAYQEKSSSDFLEPQSLGTGWGETTEFKTRTVHYDFETACVPMMIYYDSRDGLIRRGINLREYVQAKPEPDAFPGLKRDGCPFPK